MQRRLSTILAADFVGFSRLMEADEEATVKGLSEYREIIDNLVKNYHGRVFGSAGDSVIVEFSSPVEAVRCAVGIQEELNGRNTDLPTDKQMALRIGINLGDVIVEHDNLLGDGVNIASRLESLADPGGITLSRSVYEQVKKRLELRYEDMGEQRLKNIADVIQVYKVIVEDEIETPDTSVKLDLLPEYSGKPSIAVLPFTNMSGDPEQEYFSDGITEDIITALSRIFGLLVVARNSTMVYKGKSVGVKQIGKEQGVQYVLEGSVRKSGNRIRITAQLINAKTGHHHWAERYDRVLDDIFAVQDEVTRNVTLELQVQLTEGEQARLWVGGTNSIEAWECALRGWEMVERHVKEDVAEGRRLLERAVEFDPNYATAWAHLGWAHWTAAVNGWAESRESGLMLAAEAAHKGLDIEGENPDVYAILGAIHWSRGETEDAVLLSQKAVDLSPSHADNAAFLAMILSDVGKPKEALERIRAAIKLSPTYPHWYLWIVGKSHRAMGQYELAIPVYREAIEREPESTAARIWLTDCLVEIDCMEEAKSVANDLLLLQPTFSVGGSTREANYDPEKRDRILKNLRKAGLPE